MGCATRCESIIRCEEDLKNLHGWQKQQNGSIKIANDKIDKIMWWIMGQLAATVLMAAAVYFKA